MEKILVVDDDVHMVQMIGHVLRRHGYEVLGTKDPEEGLRLAQLHRPHMALLDVLMPEMNGWEMCRRLREFSTMPIVFLTAMGSSRDVIKGLELGADDYIVKPFHPDELLARVKVHLRRAPEPDTIHEVMFDDDLAINFLTREVKVRGEPVNLTPREFDLLAALVRNAEKVMTRRELATQAWGVSDDEAEQLKLYILHLRRKIERDPSRPERILTSRGVGYRFAVSR